nr:glycohydrolase toxin TNT-related protein [Dysgonomonas sp. 216]
MDNTGNNLYHTYTDHLGSLVALVKPNNTVAERYYYSPWGERTKVTNTGIANDQNCLLHRGYTMHSHIDEFGYIHMKGRVYDPATMLFLSPDPYIQASGDWLNFNRYSYCFNNPFKYTDPDGKMAWFIPVIVGVVVGGINVAVHWDQIDSFGDGFKAFGIGFAAGALGTLSGGSATAAMGGTGFTAGAIGSAYGYTTSTLVQSVGNNAAFDNPLPTAKEFGTGLVIAAGTGGIMSGISEKLDNRSFWSGKPNELPFRYEPLSGNGAKTVHNNSSVSTKETSSIQSSVKNNSIESYYPSNNGAIGTQKYEYLMPGTKIDRFGSTKGFYFSDYGTPMNMRALPATTDLSQYNAYRVLKPIPVWKGTIAPAFNQIGGGTQYMSPVNADILMHKGFIEVYTIKF